MSLSICLYTNPVRNESMRPWGSPGGVVVRPTRPTSSIHRYLPPLLLVCHMQARVAAAHSCWLFRGHGWILRSSRHDVKQM